MALLIEPTVDDTTPVSEAVVAAYSTRREQVRLMQVGELVDGAVSSDFSGISAVVAAEARVVEVVAGDEFDLETLAAATWALAARGWDVIVLVSCGRIGDAHMSLRSTPCVIQPWWLDEDGVWFGALETP